MKNKCNLIAWCTEDGDYQEFHCGKCDTIIKESEVLGPFENMRLDKGEIFETNEWVYCPKCNADNEYHVKVEDGLVWVKMEGEQ